MLMFEIEPEVSEMVTSVIHFRSPGTVRQPFAAFFQKVVFGNREEERDYEPEELM